MAKQCTFVDQSLELEVEHDENFEISAIYLNGVDIKHAFKRSERNELEQEVRYRREEGL